MKNEGNGSDFNAGYMPFEYRLGQHNYPDLRVSQTSLAPQDKCQGSTSNYATTTSYHYLTDSPFSNYAAILHCII
jgi:hypothetical protein